MPFDDLLSRHRHLTLDAYLTEIGVTPVPMSVLEAHKAEQVRLHPANPLATRTPYLAMGAATALGLFALSWATHGSVEAIAVPIILMMGFGASALSFIFVSSFCDLLNIRLRGKAEWSETDIYYYMRLNDVPPAIREVADHVRRYAPETGLRYGQLVQRSELLDPYIVVRLGDERACLGIWDGDRVIAVAEIR